MSLVHHTNILKDATESHLTVENAHALAFQDLFGGAGPSDVRDKSKEDKKTINDKLTASGFGLLDNINFYPPTKNDSLEGVTLQQYVAFVANVLLTVARLGSTASASPRSPARCRDRASWTWGSCSCAAGRATTSR